MSKSRSRSRSRSQTKNSAPAPAKKGGSGNPGVESAKYEIQFFILVPVLTVLGLFYGSGFSARFGLKKKSSIRIWRKKPGSETLLGIR